MVTAQTVLDASLASIGTPDALAGIQTISATADCTSPWGTYTTEIHSGRGGRVWFKQTWTDRAPSLIVINREGAWVTDLATGQTEILDATSVSMIRAHEFQMIPLTLNERYVDWHTNEQAAWNGVDGIVVMARDDLDLPATLYFRTSDARWAGMTLTNQRRPNETVRVVVSEWMRVAEVWLPSLVTATDSSGEFVLAFNHITINNVDNKIFSTPANLGEPHFGPTQ